jgi:hypothetical protein
MPENKNDGSIQRYFLTLEKAKRALADFFLLTT